MCDLCHGQKVATKKICVKLRKPATETLSMLMAIWPWVVRNILSGKIGTTSLEDDKRSGRSTTYVSPRYEEKINLLVHKDRQRTMNDILKRLKSNIRRKQANLWSAKNWILHDNFAPCNQVLSLLVSYSAKST